MNKHLLFIPLMALLATSCAGGHITTTPVVKNAPSVAFTRRNAVNPPTSANYYEFNISIEVEDGQNFAYDLRTGTTASNPTALFDAIGPNVCIYFSSGALGNRNPATFNASISGDLRGQTLRGFQNPENWTNNPFILQSNHLKNLTYQGMTSSTDSGFTLNQSVINIAGTAIVNPWLYDGYQDGYDDGLDDGYDDGLHQGREEGFNSGYNEGYNEGLQAYDAQTTLTQRGNYYNGILLLPSKRNLVSLCQKIVSGAITWYNYCLHFGLENPSSYLPSHQWAQPPMILIQKETIEDDIYLKFYYGINEERNGLTQYYGDLFGIIDVVRTAQNNGNNYNNRFAVWDSFLWRFEVDEPWVSYTGKPYLMKFDHPCHRYQYNHSDTPQVDGEIFQDGNQITDATDLAKCDYETDMLFAGTGAQYAEGYQDGYDDAIEAGEAYDNVFMIFAPAFQAVASFFNMSIGPIKVYYFFVLPLIIALLVLVIKLVKH